MTKTNPHAAEITEAIHKIGLARGDIEIRAMNFKKGKKIRRECAAILAATNAIEKALMSSV